MSANVRKFRQQQDIPRQSGEQARVKIVKGPDYGCTFVITGMRASIGRGENNDIVISDLKASRLHAELYANAGGWAVRDLGSANGILYKSQEVRNVKLASGDVFTVGESTIEFFTSEAATMMLVAPPKSYDQVQREQSVLNQNDQRIKALTSFGAGGAQAIFGTKGPSPKSTGGSGERRKKILMGAVGILAIMMLFEDPAPSKRQDGENEKDDGKTARNLAEFLPQAATPEIRRTAKSFFLSGFREFRERNFLRAKMQFETVLQIDPTNQLARLYMDNCDTAIKEVVDQHMDRGAKSMLAGRLRESKGHFEAVLRLLHRDQSNPIFTEAREQLKKVVKEMKAT